MPIKCTHTHTHIYKHTREARERLKALCLFPLSLSHISNVAGEEEEKIEHDKMFGLGEVRVLIMVSCDVSRRKKILWTMHTCMHACKVGCMLLAATFALLQQHKPAAMHTHTHTHTDHAMERHITHH